MSRSVSQDPGENEDGTRAEESDTSQTGAAVDDSGDHQSHRGQEDQAPDSGRPGATIAVGHRGTVAAARRAPQRIRRRRTKGWRMPAGAVFVGRPTLWGNPYRVGGPIVITADRDAERGLTHELEGRLGITVAQAVDGFRDLMDLRLARPPYDNDWADEYHGVWHARLRELAGHDLVCWCPLDQPCHADVLLELANQEASP